MKPLHHKGRRKKEVREIYKRMLALYVEIQGLGYRKLPEPIRHGWYRELLITDAVLDYKNATEILEVYEKIQPAFWGITKEKAQKAWDHKCALYMLSTDKPSISKKQYNKLSTKAKDICVRFKYKTSHRNWKTRFYVNFPKSCVRIKFTRAYIRYQKIIDPLLESETELLSQQLLKIGYYEANRAYCNDQKEWQYWKKVDANKRENNVKRQLKYLQGSTIKEINKEKIVWEIN